jgi:hypothetical protein
MSGYPTNQDFGGWCYCEDMDTLHLRRAVEGEIRQAFHGVTLGKGMSLRQAQYADRFQDAVRNAHSTSIGKGEITNDWSQVSLDELERDCIALLDAFGFRYYIPALMLSVLDHYDPSSMRVIGTLGGLYPKKDSWDHSMYQYSLLNSAQKTAIAHFLEALPRLVELDSEDQKIVPRALRNYWSEYLQPKTTE